MTTNDGGDLRGPAPATESRDPGRGATPAATEPIPARDATPADTTRLTGRLMVRLLIALIASLALGALTSFAQGWLPDSLAPFANSVSGWTLLIALLIWWAAVPLWASIVLGPAGFALLVVGYAVTSAARGLAYNPTRFLLVALVCGPFLGLAVGWMRLSTDIRAALGTALVSGIGLGEAAYGLTSVADTTGVTYWIIAGAVGIAVLVAMSITRLRTARLVATAAVGMLVVAGLFLWAWQILSAST